MKPVGYIVAIQGEPGLRLPSFPEVHDTLEEANAERDRLAALRKHAARYDPLVVLEVHELGEAGQ